MKTLSIIIPIYNVEEYLAECLDSVVNVDDIEIILVNDCTPDNSMKIAESYVAKYNNISLIHHDINKGLGAARNTGIENASGKYIFFLDSDDYLDTTKLKPLIDKLKEINYDQVLISFIRFSEEDENWPLQYEKIYKKYDGTVLNRSNFMVLLDIINLSPIRIIKREKILSDNIWFPNGLYEDVLWSFWYLYSCESTLIINNRIYFYRQRPASILGSVSNKHMDIIKQQKRTLALFESKQVPHHIILSFKNRFLVIAKWIFFETERLPVESHKIFCKEIIIKLESSLIHSTSQIKQLDSALAEKSNIIKELDSDLTEKSNIIKELDSAFARISKIRFSHNPMKKIKAFKQLMKIYHSIK